MNTNVNWKRNTAIFLTCQALSIFGSSLVQYAIMWHVTLTTKSGVAATVMIALGFLPTLVLSPFGGVWADRYNRKLLIALSDGSIAVVTAVLAVAFAFGRGSLGLLMVAVAARAFGAAVQQPCVNAVLPDIVPQDKLTRVNGINQSINSALMLIAPMASGALMNFLKMQHIFLIDLITATIAIAFMLLFLKLPKRAPYKAEPGVSKGYFSDLKKGFEYIKNEVYLRNFFIFTAFFMFSMAPVAFLSPLQTARVFGEEVWRLTAIEIAFSSGAMLGGIVIAAWGGFKNRVHTMALGCLFMGLTTLALFWPFSFIFYLSMMLIAGLTMPLFNTPSMVLLQEKVDPAFMGRVFGVMSMISSSLMPVAMLFFGPLADMINIKWLMLFSGIAMIILTFIFLQNKAFVAAGYAPQQPQGEALQSAPEPLF